MFAVYGTSGQMFQGPFEELRKVAPSLRLSRARPVNADLDRPDAVEARGGQESAPRHSPAERALHAYADTQQGVVGRQQLRLVSDVMTREPVLMPDNLTVWEALQRMVEAGVSQMPVVNAQSRLVGALTWGDFMRSDRLPDPAANPLVWRARMAQPVTDWMFSPVPSVEPETELRKLAVALLETGLPGLPVVAGDGTVQGYVSRSDILRAVTHDPPLDLWAR
jgi:CBS-domain-containing membrane protein